MTTPQTEQRELTAGRELDALVAEKVTGWAKITPSRLGDYFTGVNPVTGVTQCLPAYSTNIADTWEVVEALRRRAYVIELTIGIGAFCRVRGLRSSESVEGAAPLAICLAALKAVQS